MKWFRNLSFRNLSLATKLISLSILLFVVISSILVAYNLNKLNDVSVKKAEAEAISAGKTFTMDFNNQIAGIESLMETLSRSMLSYQQNGVDREQVVEMLDKELKGRTNIISLYTLWEPDAFDGKDKENVNKTSYDNDTGRFLPYVVRDGQKIVFRPLDGYEKEGIGDYYLTPKTTKKTYYKDPYIYPINGKDVQMLSITVPILNEKGDFLGIVGTDVSLEYLESEAAKYKPMGGYIALITDKGNYVANPNEPSSTGKFYGSTEDKKQLWQKVAAGEYVAADGVNSKGIDVKRYFDSFPLPGSEVKWHTQIVIPKSEVMKELVNGRNISIAIGLLAVVLFSGILAFAIHRMVVRNMKQLVSKLSLIAQGDLTQKLEIKGKDEFGKMAVYFNSMTEKLREMFEMIADLTVALNMTAEQLSDSAEETNKASESIAESAQEVAAGSEVQSRYATDTVTAMEEMATGVQKIADSSSKLSQSANGVADQTVKGNEQITIAVTQMGNIEQSVVNTGRLVEGLSRRSEQIGGVIDLISGISKQTHLLALNAAIEASRVGEQGKGFAVVAMEVRKLAEQSKKATEEVAELVYAVREETQEASQAMHEGVNQVKIGVASVTDSGVLFTEIMNEVADINDQIQEVSAAAEQMSASSQEIAASVDELARIAEDASKNSTNVAAASEEQLASMQEITSSAEALNMMVAELVERMQHFKIK